MPAPYGTCFQTDPEVLETHRAYDPGALELARRIAKQVDCPLIHSRVTRLLVDLNRSVTNHRVFSSYSRSLDKAARQSLLERYYWPYRTQVEDATRSAVRGNGVVVHISVHSFTPHLNEKVRRADIGLLYDPSRAGEKRMCMALQAELCKTRSELGVRRNYPYRGSADGLTRHLRSLFGPGQYLGLELEVNQKWPLGNSDGWRELQTALARSIADTLPEL